MLIRMTSFKWPMLYAFLISGLIWLLIEIGLIELRIIPISFSTDTDDIEPIIPPPKKAIVPHQKPIEYHQVVIERQPQPIKEEPVNTGPKTILYWTDFYGIKDFNFGIGSEPFIKHNCPVTNCYITNDRNYMDIDKFDALIFHGAEYHPKGFQEIPSKRSPKQRYVVYSMESPANRPIYPARGFFNITLTYRLDSDIVTYYFRLEDMQGNKVAPDLNPNWQYPILTVKDLKQYEYIYNRKNKAAAWFVSNCNSKNEREAKGKELQKILGVDIYGKCGTLRCPRDDEAKCNQMLKEDYFFYLAYENSNCVDYVSEKAMTAFKNEAVPVVMNGANMDHFLPPGSYIDATKMTVKELADLMLKAMNDKMEYLRYFWWKKYYKIAEKPLYEFCQLCELLNDEKFPVQNYADMTNWWEGGFRAPTCENFRSTRNPLTQFKWGNLEQLKNMVEQMKT